MLRQLLFIALALVVAAQFAQGDSECQNKRKDALNALKNGVFGQYIPSCEENGDYKQAQCNISTGFCFCVDPKTGKQTGDQKKGTVNCESS